MKNYKLDIKEVTDQFNALNEISKRYDNYHPLCHGNITQDQISEMIQSHAFKLGVVWCDGSKNIYTANEQYLLIQGDRIINSINKTKFDNNESEKIGLEFFNIKPEKFVTVKMPEEDYDYIKKWQKRPSLSDLIFNKWELIK